MLSVESTPWVCCAWQCFFTRKLFTQQIINGEISFIANNYSGSPIGECKAVFSFAASGFSGVANKDDWCPGGAGDWSGKSVARDGAARGPPVLGLRPLLGHSLAFQATLGPSGGLSRTKAGHLGARWQTWNRGWRLQERRRRPPTSSLRTSPTRGLASKLMRMDSNTPLSLDESSRETSGYSL